MLAKPEDFLKEIGLLHTSPLWFLNPFMADENLIGLHVLVSGETKTFQKVLNKFGHQSIPSWFAYFF